MIGALLFYLQGKLFPEPKPVIGPLGEARIEALQQQWFASVGRLPTAEQQARMVRAELDRDMLFRRVGTGSASLRSGGLPAPVAQYALPAAGRGKDRAGTV